MPQYFQLANNRLPLTVDTIGCKWDQEKIIRPDGYPYYHWLQTETGRGTIVIDEEKHLLKTGDGILIAPFVPHTYHAVSAWKTNFVTFNGTLSEEIRKIVGRAPYLLAKESQFFSFQEWIRKAIELHENNMTIPLQHSLSCYEFLLHISQFEEYEEYRNNPLYQKYVMPVVKHIETNFAANLTIEELASSVYITPQYLTKLFRRLIGITPIEYIKNTRLNKSKELLVNHPELNIQRISHLVGYNNPSYFISVFKDTTGSTPLKFRANSKW